MLTSEYIYANIYVILERREIMNDIVIYTNRDFGEVRTTQINSEPFLFVRCM